MAGFLDEKRSEIVARLKELEPFVNEYSRLEAAAAALDAVAADRGPRRTAERRAPAASKRRRGTAATGRSAGRGRPKGTGTRAKEALVLVKASPGIKIPELAEQMGIKQNYLYRVMPGLAADGLVTKDGQGWHPTDPA